MVLEASAPRSQSPTGGPLPPGGRNWYRAGCSRWHLGRLEGSQVELAYPERSGFRSEVCDAARDDAVGQPEGEGNFLITLTGDQVVEQVAFAVGLERLSQASAMPLDGHVDGEEVTAEIVGNVVDLFMPVRGPGRTAKLCRSVRHSDPTQPVGQPFKIGDLDLTGYATGLDIGLELFEVERLFRRVGLLDDLAEQVGNEIAVPIEQFDLVG